MHTSVKSSYRIRQASYNAGREVVWNIGPVYDYEAQSGIVPFLGVMIRKGYELI
jgi:hypothetical protein